MARNVNEKQHAERREEILNAAQQLIYTRGYQQMSIQDLLNMLQISKGAFYHYYNSKQALLEAIVERMVIEAERVLTAVVQDPHLPALEKFQQFFTTGARWKTGQKDFLLSLLRVWYADDNALVRQKVMASMVQRVTPLLAAIVHQGVAEGVFNTAFPDEVSRVLMTVIQGFGEQFATLLFTEGLDPGVLAGIERSLAAYDEVIERILGAPAGTFHLMDIETIKAWLPLP